jgi:hypothetical protein
MPKEESVQDVVQDVGKMKTALKAAVAGGDEEDGGGKKRVPICIGLDNGGEAMVSASKKGSPKKLRTEAIKAIQTAKLTSKITADNAHLYFGYAFTNDDAPGILRIELNKKPQGEGKLATAVFKRVRTAGFGEVVFSVNENLEGESEEGVPVAGVVPPPPPPPPGPKAPAYDAGQLQKMLAALIPRIPGAAANDPARLETLKKMATMVGVNIKTSNLNIAATGIADLTRALDAPPPPPPPPLPQANAGALAKTSQIWLATHKRMTSDIEKLRAELIATYKDQGISGEVESRYDSVVAELLKEIDDSLAKTLEAIGAAPDPTTRASLIEEARKIMARYAAALAKPIVAELDANPFVPLSIQKTVSATLSGISGQVH